VKRIFLVLIICLWATPAMAQSNLLPTIQRLRAEYPTPMARWQVADLLNRVAWAHRAEGWGLLHKPVGSRCPAPHGFDISCDILIHAPSIQHFDVLIDAEGVATPTWHNVGPCVLGPKSGCSMSNYRIPTRPAQSITTRGDFEGDGRSDLSVFRPSSGGWWVWQSNGAGTLFRQWGTAGDLPVAGDFDGDGRSDPAVYRPSSGTWYVLHSVNGYTTSDTRTWGTNGDIPVVADFNGDGRTDLTVFRPSTGVWHIWYSSSSGFLSGNWGSLQWGQAGDVPVSADFDGDSRTDLTIFRPSTGAWFAAFSSTNYSAWGTRSWGISGDIPIAGDFDGDGAADLTVYRPSDRHWYIWFSQGGFVSGNYVAIPWGASGDKPAAGDFDGDGRTDISVWRPSTGWWFSLNSSLGFGGGSSYQWGTNGDVPVLGP
jgi:hypothetical protein